MNATAKCGLALAAAAMTVSAYADFDLDLDMGVKPIKDVRTSTCGPEIGYAGTLACQCDWGLDEAVLFGTRKEETARLMKEAGAWLQRMWSANAWFANRGKKNKKGLDCARPDLAFPFWKENGFKVLFTLEAWGGEKSRREINEFVDYIITNGYKDVVAGFELGNESYFGENYPKLAPIWTKIVDDLVKKWPGVKLGINLCEYFDKNPDLTQVRARMLGNGEIKTTDYFSTRIFSRYSAKFVVAMAESGALKHITHVIYHAYGAESPYSCSYYGFQRFRNFNVAFPELKGKNFWLTEIRPRSDEDNRCQRLFRESLIMAHYSLMAICQPDLDGFNHHQLHCISGGLYQSVGGEWQVQWRDAGGSLKDYRAPASGFRMDLGHAGVMYRILTEAIKEHPLLLHHGTSQATDTEDTFFTSARVCDQVYTRRRAIKEGKKTGGFLGIGADYPEVAGEVEWVAATTPGRDSLCLMMVNTKNVPEKVHVTVKGKQFAAPTYRTLSCPEKYLDCREVPGDGRTWRQASWEDTQWGYDVVPMEMYEGMQPVSDFVDITIEPHTVQSVTVSVRNVPKPKK